MTKLTIHLPDNLLQAIQETAKRDKVPVSQAIRVALAAHFKVSLPKKDHRTLLLPATPTCSTLVIEVAYAHLGRAKDTIQQGLHIQAIRDLRTDTGLGLCEAKRVVDFLREEQVSLVELDLRHRQ